MKRFVLCIGILFCVCAAYGQQDKPKPLTVTPRTEIKLDHPADSTATQLLYQKQVNLILQSQILQKQYQDQVQMLQGDFNGYQAQITAWVDKTKKDNGLGDGVEYDPGQDKWFRVTTPPAKVPAKPADPVSVPAKPADAPPAKK